MSQLERLARPFPDRLIHTNPSGGGSYVKHSVVTEKLLAVLGPFSFELVKEIRGQVDGTPPNPQGKSDRAKRGTPDLDHAVVGVVCRLSVVVDGRAVSIEEVGDCESPHNWPHDGARLKDAMSDALKRCAMRLGVTLHLWSGSEFSLYEQLHKDAEGSATGQAGPVAAPSRIPAEPVPTGRKAAPSAISPAGNESTPAATPESSSPIEAPGVSKARREKLKSRCVALQADGISVADEREALRLPLVDSCNEAQFILFEQLVTDLESALAAPFAKAEA